MLLFISPGHFNDSILKSSGDREAYARHIPGIIRIYQMILPMPVMDGKAYGK